MRLDLRRTLQVSDGARQLQDAVEGSRAHVQFQLGGMPQALATVIQPAVLAHLAGPVSALQSRGMLPLTPPI